MGFQTELRQATHGKRDEDKSALNGEQQELRGGEEWGSIDRAGVSH